MRLIIFRVEASYEYCNFLAQTYPEAGLVEVKYLVTVRVYVVFVLRWTHRITES
jgi:hypothetical protein